MSRDDNKLALVSESLRGEARSQDDLKLDLVGVTVEGSSKSPQLASRLLSKRKTALFIICYGLVE